jgi:dipeptidyl aminopeptidase/acylaminoacyl peptidase
MMRDMKQFTHESINDITSLGSIKISPAGGKVAWVVSRPDLEGDDYSYELHALDLSCAYDAAENGHANRTVFPAAGGSGFCWMNEEKLVYPALRQEDDKTAVSEGAPMTVFQCADMAGDEVELFRVPISGASPIGFLNENILFTAWWDNSAGVSSVCDETYEEACRRAKAERAHFRVCDEQTYRHDGMGYINKQRRRLFLYEPAEGKLVAVSDPMFGVEDVCIAPTGEIVYCGAEQSSRKTLAHGIFAYDPASGDTRTLTGDTGYHIFKLVSCGDRILFFGYKVPEHMGFFIEDMLSVPLAGGAPRMESALEASVGTLYHSDISRLSGTTAKVADGELYVQLHEGATPRVYRYLGDGESAASRDDALASCPDFVPVSPETIKVSCFDRVADITLCVGMDAFGLQEVFAGKNGDWRKLTAYNDDFDYALSVPEYLSFEGADGVLLDGWVIPPADYTPGRDYPGVLMIHGGPHVAYGDVLVCDMQMLAAKGYFVFYCNPRGSGGKGRSFANINGRYGTVDFDDIMRFTDCVLSTWWDISPERLGVAGGSYGGFMTNWIITHTDRFKAAVPQCSIANWFTMYYMGDVPYFVRSEMDGTPYAHSERLWRASPIRYIENAKTPALFLQYEMDFRCPMEEAIQMYSGLLENGTETRLVMFSGDSHSMMTAGKPSHRVRRTTEMHAWFGHYLKSEEMDP